jgi:endonuclease/exonuclease/phosphatase family metal-dependent hydrolase
LALAVALTGCPTPSEDSGTTDDTGEHVVPTGTFRVATWNIQYVGASGSAEHDAALLVLARLGADVVAINEVKDDADVGYLRDLAASAGYDHVVVPADNPFGGLRNAILSKHAFTAYDVPDSAELSGDTSANDMTRWAVVATIAAPFGSLSVVSQHWKSGFDEEDQFRRAVDGLRTAQAAEREQPATSAVLVVGDVNAELDEMPEYPSVLTDFPAGMPSSYWLGADLYGQLTSDGLANNAFAGFDALGFVAVDALQPDGRDGTRPASNKRIDYILASPGVPVSWQAEVYDCWDEGFEQLPKFGDALERDVCSTASDHLPVLIDLG